MNVDEQAALIAAIPEPMRPMAELALFTGLRWSELSWLRREDIQGEDILVRRSTGGGPTKSGKPRRVPLLPPARAALDAQLTSVKASCPWVFPSEDGKPRQQRPSAWKSWVTASKIGREIRWHDLRHTCATSLLAGWWGGERWTLDEVCRMLGHAQISTTERYARKLDETLTNAAKKKFPGGNGNGGSGGKHSVGNAFLNRRSRVRIAPGAQQKTCSIPDRTASGLGTVGELPRALQRAVKATSARSREGVLYRRLAKVWPALMRGDRVTAEPELAAMARTFGVVAGGDR